MFKSIVVGADGSSTARQAVEAAVELSCLTFATLHIVTAFDPKAFTVNDLPPEFRHSSTINPADLLLDSLAEIGRLRGLQPVVHPFAGDPSDAVVKTAEELDADLIVVGNKGMKGMRRVLGSIPNTVAHSAHCSVLIVDTVGD